MWLHCLSSNIRYSCSTGGKSRFKYYSCSSSDQKLLFGLPWYYTWSALYSAVQYLICTIQCSAIPDLYYTVQYITWSGLVSVWMDWGRREHRISSRLLWQTATGSRRSLHCTVLYCTVLNCTVLNCTVLNYTVLYCTVLQYITLPVQ